MARIESIDTHNEALDLVPDACRLFKWKDPPAPDLSKWKGVSPNVELTQWLLLQISAGHSMEEVASLYGFTREDLGTLLRCAIDVLDRVARHSFVRKHGRRLKVSDSLKEALSHASIDLSRASQRKFEPLRRWFKSTTEDKLKLESCFSWLHCRRGIYLDYCAPQTFQPLLSLLRDSKIPASSFRLCVPRNPTSDLMSVIEDAKYGFLLVFSVYPRIDEVDRRVGRPICYLQVDHVSTGDSNSSAGGSTAGLDAWIVSMWIHLEWFRTIEE